MANKSFVIQYVIKARDRFSVVAKRIAKAMDKMNRSANVSRTSMERFNQTSRNTVRSLNRVSSAYNISARSVDRFSAAQRRSRMHLVPPIVPGRIPGRRPGGIIPTSRGRFAQSAAVIGGAVTGVGAIGLANRFKNAARDKEEIVSKYNIVFSNAIKEAEEKASELGNAYDLAGSTIKKMLGDTGDLLSGFGFTDKQSLEMSARVAKISADIASLSNVQGGAEKAARALTKGLLGETEALTILGIKLLDEDIKARMRLNRSKGFTYATKRQAKAEATLQLAIEQSAKSVGNYALTRYELANRERAANEATKETMELYGEKLLPMYLKLADAQIKVSKSLSGISPGGKTAMLVFAGIAAALLGIVVVAGAVMLLLPMLTAGFGVLTALLLPFLGVLAVAGGGYALFKNWEGVKDFAAKAGDKLGITDAIEKAKELSAPKIKAAKEAGSAMARMWSAVEMMKHMESEGHSWDEIKDRFFGRDQEMVKQKTTVEMGVRLADGLEEDGERKVNGKAVRRNDTGSMRAVP